MFGAIPKVSYSLISSVGRGLSLDEAVKRVSDIGVDMIHYDISEKTTSLSAKDLPRLKELTELPFDIHLTVDDPRPYLSDLSLASRDYCCIHIENKYTLKELWNVKKKLLCNFGLAINVETSVLDIFPVAEAVDYALFMAAEPGVSGGQFDERVLEKIKTFREKFPRKRIHVDGGINNITATLVRDIGVDALISGSYILKEDNPTNQVAKLVGQNIHLPVSAIMYSGDRMPWVKEKCTISEVAHEIDKKGIGCTCVLDSRKRLAGFITDHDIRLHLISQPDLSAKSAKDIMNPSPRAVISSTSILRLMRELETSGKVFSTVPVVDDDGMCVGVLRLQDVLFRNVAGMQFR